MASSTNNNNNVSNASRHTRTSSRTTAHAMLINTDDSQENNNPNANNINQNQLRRRESGASLYNHVEDTDYEDDHPPRNSTAVSGEWPRARHRSLSLPHNSIYTQQRIQEDEDSIDGMDPLPEKPAPVTWMSLPRKGQLGLLGLCRVFDFLQIASLQAYMFYQLKSFDPELSDASVSTQAGILQGAFTAAQFATAIPWGRIADTPWGGRKFVLLVGLLGTGVSCLGVAFSSSFGQAVFWRSFGGAINGTVGIIRTMIAENIKEKKYQSRAFLILPIGFNIASLFGPVMGGLLADPVASYPRIFGANSPLGGDEGVQWLVKYPYALPMILNTFFMTFSAVCVAIGLEETLESAKNKTGVFSFLSRYFSQLLRSVIPRSSSLYDKIPLQNPDDDHLSDDSRSESYEMEEKASFPLSPRRVLPFRRIWIPNVLATLLAQAFFDFQMGAFNNLWLLFLSTPRYDPNDPTSLPQKLPFIFTGGLGMPPQSVGFATSILGVIGMILQFSIYPSINGRLGTVKSYQYFLLLFPLAYALAPYIALSPSTSAPPAQATGPGVWISIVLVLLLQVTARTFTLPTSIILLNNCSPHPSVLGTIHGIGQSVSSAFRTLGPVFGGAWYGLGLESGVVGLAWWLIAAISCLGCVAAWWVYEGTGHEILLPGEEEHEMQFRK